MPKIPLTVRWEDGTETRTSCDLEDLESSLFSRDFYDEPERSQNHVRKFVDERKKKRKYLLAPNACGIVLLDYQNKTLWSAQGVIHPIKLKIEWDRVNSVRKTIILWDANLIAEIKRGELVAGGAYVESAKASNIADIQKTIDRIRPSVLYDRDRGAYWDYAHKPPVHNWPPCWANLKTLSFNRIRHFITSGWEEMENYVAREFKLSAAEERKWARWVVDPARM